MASRLAHFHRFLSLFPSRVPKYTVCLSSEWPALKLAIHRSSKPEFLELDVRVAAKERICLHCHLESKLQIKLEIPRVGEEESKWQEFCDFEPYLKTNFGTSMNALPNFLTKMGGKNTRS
ncbi:hypothetical protein AVEN_262170-1 [Araneus ventricosus]|uniref:Uncharacterized protein n=1 Tax=Araneus ventricosus TaxID=182803 RepID=A0A4Y2EKE2_ARAVE|nr:hypothetical protein AVEN_262170-1 [Araneus ventricosus]